MTADEQKEPIEASREAIHDGDRREPASERESASGEVSLERIHVGRVSDAAVDQIAALIASFKIQVGDQLPSERQLMQQLGVSRASVREALRILEAQGLLKVHPGRGAFVIARPEQANAAASVLSWLQTHGKEAYELADVREALDGKAAYLAAQRISEQELEDMRNVLRRMEEHERAGRMEQVTAADRDFHRLLSAAGGNEVLRGLADHVADAMSGMKYSILALPSRSRRSIQEHWKIIRALEAHDPEAAAAAVVEHMQSGKEALRALGAGAYEDRNA
jgi:GntR family transcriptional repressor for pyruvate dehydrogenase complex